MQFDIDMEKELVGAPASVRAAVLGKGNVRRHVEDIEMQQQGEKRRSSTTVAEIDSRGDDGQGAIVVHDNISTTAVPATSDVPTGDDAAMEPSDEVMTFETNQAT